MELILNSGAPVLSYLSLLYEKLVSRPSKKTHCSLNIDVRAVSSLQTVKRLFSYVSVTPCDKTRS